MRPLLYTLFLLSLPSQPVVAQTSDPLAPGEHQVELRSVNIWYLVRGEGPVLLIQPGGAGWGGDATIYIETLRPLEAAHTVVYVDPRGIGRSGRSADPTLYAMDEYVEDLEALRRHLGLAALTVAGHSHGGSVALKYALAYPQRVDRLSGLGCLEALARFQPLRVRSRVNGPLSRIAWQLMRPMRTPTDAHGTIRSAEGSPHVV
jgi:pimeloyl-ACP methyl ester carboxylesterase